MFALPLLVISPAELIDQYRSWLAVQNNDLVDLTKYSVVQLLYVWLNVSVSTMLVQVVGVMLLLAPLALRRERWIELPFRQLALASVLMFCVLFNHQAENPTFVIALAGIALWFTVSRRSISTLAALLLVFVCTVLAASDAMPNVLKDALFLPYRF